MANELVLTGLAPSTSKSYMTGQTHFVRFAAARQLSASSIFPVSSFVILAFVTYLFALTTTLSYNTIKSYLCHVKMLSKTLAADTTAFSCERLAYALRSIRRRRGDRKRKKRVPITIQLLLVFFTFLDPALVAHHALRAVLAVGVYGLFRSGELVPKHRGADGENLLRRCNVLWVSDTKVTIHLDQSKTDTFREGVDIHLFKDGSESCPYSALRHHWENAPDKSSTAPVFQNEDGSALTYTQLSAAIKNLAAAAGLDPSSISGHSMRVGGATSLAMLGVPAHIIKEFGRWRSLAYQIYTRMSPDVHESVARSLGKEALFKRGNFFGGMALDDACKLSLDNIEIAFNGR